MIRVILANGDKHDIDYGEIYTMYDDTGTLDVKQGEHTIATFPRGAWMGVIDMAKATTNPET